MKKSQHRLGRGFKQMRGKEEGSRYLLAKLSRNDIKRSQQGRCVGGSGEGSRQRKDVLKTPLRTLREQGSR